MFAKHPQFLSKSEGKTHAIRESESNALQRKISFSFFESLSYNIHTNRSRKKSFVIFIQLFYILILSIFFLSQSCPRRDNKLKIPRKLCRRLHNNAIHWQREKSVNVHKRPLELSFIVQQNFSQGELCFQYIIYKSPWLYPVPKKN